MIDFTTLSVGDRVKVRYTTGERMKGSTIEGEITRIWRPEDSCAQMWQGQVNNGWCFHDDDDLLIHEPCDPAT